MVDVLDVVFVIALEAGLFVLPCSVHLVGFLQKCPTRPEHGFNSAGGTGFRSLQGSCKS